MTLLSYRDYSSPTCWIEILELGQPTCPPTSMVVTALSHGATGSVSTSLSLESHWMVIGQRHDSHMYDTDWTNENGRVVVEPLQTAAAAYIPNS